jgi:hypothetical protein
LLLSFSPFLTSLFHSLAFFLSFSPSLVSSGDFPCLLRNEAEREHLLYKRSKKRDGAILARGRTDENLEGNVTCATQTTSLRTH